MRQAASAARLLSAIYGDDNPIEFELDDSGSITSVLTTTNHQED